MDENSSPKPSLLAIYNIKTLRTESCPIYISTNQLNILKTRAQFGSIHIGFEHEKEKSAHLKYHPE